MTTKTCTKYKLKGWMSVTGPHLGSHSCTTALNKKQYVHSNSTTSFSLSFCASVNHKHGGGDGSVVRALDLGSKGPGFKSLLERQENFLLQSQLSVLTLISVSVQPRVTAVARKRPWSFCQKRRLQLKHAYTLRMWLCMK